MKARPLLWLGLYAAIIAAILPSFLLAYPIPELNSKLVSLGSILFLVSGAIGWGKWLNKRIRLWPSQPGWDTLFSAALGFGVIAILILFLGWLAPGPLSIKMGMLSLCLASFSVTSIVALGRHVKNKSLHAPSSFSLLETSVIVLAVLGAGASLLSCFSPITYYDSLVYHVALPALYKMEGVIRPIPFNLYSFFPAQSEMLYLYILSQLPEPEYAINLLCWAASFGIGVGLFQWAKESHGRLAGLVALGLWWSTPTVLFLSTGGYIDMFLAFFIFTSLRAFTYSLTEEETGKWVFVSGLFAGFACSTKYTGAICAIALGLYLITQISFKKAPIKLLALFCLGVIIPFSVWLIKNGLAVHNPVFPFLYRTLGGDVGWTMASAQGYFGKLAEYGLKSHLLFELFLAPFKITTTATQFGGGFDVLGDFGWPLFLFGSFLAAFVIKRNRTHTFLLVYFLLHFLLWFFTKPVLRFLVGLLPLAVLLTSIALTDVFKKNGARVRVIGALLIAPWLVSNFFFYFFINGIHHPFAVPLGHQTRDTYLNNSLPFYPLYDFINKNLRSTDKVLLIAEQRTFHLQKPFVCSNLFAPSQVALWCNSAASIDDVRQKFNKEGITHILINGGELKRFGGYSAFGFSTEGTTIFENFMAQSWFPIARWQETNLYTVKK